MRRNLRDAMRLLRAAFGFEAGVYVPYAYIDQANRTAKAGYPELEATFASRRSDFALVLQRVDAFRDALASVGEAPPPEPRWAQNWFPPLDAAVAYALTRQHRPKTIIEVGGGHSSRFFARAARDEGFAVRHVVVDPGARAKEKIGGLNISHVAQPLEAADLALFSGLQAGDIVSLDGSHKMLPGSDVDVFIGRVMPRLPVGVLVHIHDCFLPDAYPPAWDNRVYTEQSGLLGLVLAQRDWPCVFASHYVATRMRDAVAASLVGPLTQLSAAGPTSFWVARA